MRFHVIYYHRDDTDRDHHGYAICFPDDTRTRLTRLPESYVDHEVVTWTDANGVVWKYPLNDREFLRDGAGCAVFRPSLNFWRGLKGRWDVELPGLKCRLLERGCSRGGLTRIHDASGRRIAWGRYKN